MNDELVEEIDKATVAHALWKARMISVIEGETHSIDRKSAGDPHACEFGKWLDGNRNLGPSHPEYELVRAKHDAFHAVLADCLDKIASGRSSEVQRSLGVDGEFRNLSGGMVLELLRWRDRLTEPGAMA